MSRAHHFVHFPLAIAALLGLTAAAHAGELIVKMTADDGIMALNRDETIVRWRLDEATGNISRNGALFVHTTSSNLFVGAGAGNTSVTAIHNTGVGLFALEDVTSGNDNSAFGAYALRNNSSGLNNSAFGNNALTASTTGLNNSAFGSNALLSNTVGASNSAFGRRALDSNTTGVNNSAFGVDALQGNSTGQNNNAFGLNALLSHNGSNNNAFGVNALLSLTSGNDNVAIGHAAIDSLATGNSNVAIGGATATNFASGSNNVLIGTNAAAALTTGSDNIVISHAAGQPVFTTGSNNILVGHSLIGVGHVGSIRIGDQGTHDSVQIAGIFGATSFGGSSVLVNSNGTLGTTTSSARFKQDVEDMGESSELLMKLRPVSFRYREQVAQGEDVGLRRFHRGPGRTQECGSPGRGKPVSFVRGSARRRPTSRQQTEPRPPLECERPRSREPPDRRHRRRG